MAYNFFSPYSGVMPQYQQPTQPPTNSLIWVQGESGAKSYLVGAGQTALLMDSEQSRFYIKSTDNSGMPMPLRTFEYSEITANNTPHNAVVETPDYVTREEFEKRLSEIQTKPTTKKGSVKDAESAV